MTQLIPHSDRQTYRELARLSLPGTWTPVGWIPPERLCFDDWCAYAPAFAVLSSAIHIWLGDWLNYGEQRWGEMYAQAIDMTDFAYDTLARDKYVMGRVSFCIRRQNLTFSHYQAVAALETEAERALWLERASVGENGQRWSVRQLKEGIKGALPAGPAPSDNGRSAPAPITSRAELAQARAELDAAPDPVRAAMVHTFEAALKLPTTLDAEWHECPKCGHRWAG